ncbi:VTT domain-containing protein [Patescibacteria group bacterium]|nr:VTT domain-containing protein [Patescibacteria group bacterium]MBU1499567.1 VTT domain-containing protein [Patescibacteria group bacterium]
MILQSKPFKIFTLVFAVVFYLLAFVIAFTPEPFLKFGYLGIFVFNLFGPGTFLIPVASRHFMVFGVALATSLGMAINDSVSWLAGKNGDIVFPRGRRVARIEAAIKKYGPFALFFWALIPFPYDFIAVIAGYLKLPFKRFLIPTFLGRLLRFILMGFGIVAIWGKALPLAY